MPRRNNADKLADVYDHLPTDRDAMKGVEHAAPGAGITLDALRLRNTVRWLKNAQGGHPANLIFGEMDGPDTATFLGVDSAHVAMTGAQLLPKVNRDGDAAQPDWAYWPTDARRIVFNPATLWDALPWTKAQARDATATLAVRPRHRVRDTLPDNHDVDDPTAALAVTQDGDTVAAVPTMPVKSVSLPTVPTLDWEPASVTFQKVRPWRKYLDFAGTVSDHVQVRVNGNGAVFTAEGDVETGEYQAPRYRHDKEPPEAKESLFSTDYLASYFTGLGMNRPIRYRFGSDYPTQFVTPAHGDPDAGFLFGMIAPCIEA